MAVAYILAIVLGAVAVIAVLQAVALSSQNDHLRDRLGTARARRSRGASDLDVDPWHHVTIQLDAYGTHVRFHCTAPDGAVCREEFACWLDLNTSCDVGAAFHHESCPRLRVPYDGCTVKEWVDLDPDVMGYGLLRFPVATEPSGSSGEGFVFLPRHPVTVIDEPTGVGQ
ncbi:MAG: hypothetical protein F2667_12580 [Actinobacteria bacterium]|uniref:Unannotated protein n=1 Tax=freshwater metagenome TaxID=449393 RepID=A0A6J6RZI1_9ZZZZ|nr:hypothetical protein [Actinomycetota bacterium]